MADLICFPQERNVGKARRVAAVYLNKPTDRGKTSYWGDICGRLEHTMRRCGFPDQTIEKEIRGFKCAVELELGRLTNRDQGPGAA